MKIKNEYDANKELKLAADSSDDDDYFSWKRHSLGNKSKKSFRVERTFKYKNNKHQH